MTPPPTSKDELAKWAKEAVDTAVGLGVLGLQKLQVGRVEVSKRLASHEAVGAGYEALRSEALRQAGRIDTMVTEARHTLEATLSPMTEHLPEPARHLSTLAQARIDELHTKVSQFLSAASAQSDHTGGDPQA